MLPYVVPLISGIAKLKLAERVYPIMILKNPFGIVTSLVEIIFETLNTGVCGF